jgi:hypothetical protein
MNKAVKKATWGKNILEELSGKLTNNSSERFSPGKEDFRPFPHWNQEKWRRLMNKC